MKHLSITITLLLHFSFIVSQDISYSAPDFKGTPLDQMMVEIMKIENGIFIEVGAYNGLWCSNTKLLEECYGWKGILIEPCEKVYPTLCKNRPLAQCFNCALGSFAEDNTYAYGDFQDSPMASFTGRCSNKPKDTKVLIRSLQSILDECNITHVNFFSLDTEGYELNILKGIDFDKITFDYILIEIYKDQYEEIVSLLKEKGYELECCLSNYSKATNPDWDGTHNDYLFKRTS